MQKQAVGNTYDFQTAISRNLGWIMPEEQQLLASVHVGIIGLGGVGGQYAEILTRLGVTRFTICDPDHFSVENSNRQNECKTSNYGRSKSEAIATLIKDINPTATVNVLAGAMVTNQVPKFCDSIDIYLDGLDFFVLDIRIAIFREMHRLGKPAITAAPIGAGSACLVFAKDSMSFDDYFGFERSKDEATRSQMFLLGLAPSLMHIKYLQDRTRVKLGDKKAPSLPMGVYSCASVMATTVLKLVLNRGKVYKAPWCVHYDPYLYKIKKTYLWLGYRNPIQQLKLRIIQWVLRSKDE